MFPKPSGRAPRKTIITCLPTEKDERETMNQTWDVMNMWSQLKNKNKMKP